MSTVSRRSRRHPAPVPPPPPSPKILHFPRIRRSRRKQPSTSRRHRNINPFLLLHRHHRCSGVDLRNLFHREIESDSRSIVAVPNCNSRNLSVERRNRSEEDEEGCDGGGANRIEEDKWMFQAEMLRAECNFLRMEREFALKKLEGNRVKMERTLRSAVQTLVSGKQKIFEGTNVNAVLEKEIEDLSDKLEELHRSSRVRDYIVRNCSNFDEKTCLLRRRMGKLRELHDENHLTGLQGMDESDLSLSSSHEVDKQDSISNGNTENKFTEMDEKNKMDGLSKGMMLESRPEEEESSVSNSKGVVCPDLSIRPARQELVSSEDNRYCSGHCRAIVHRIVEQVRAESEQWSQMQEMLERVRGEMEELQASHNFWERLAKKSAHEIQSLKHAVKEWKGKALGYEVKANEVEQELSLLREELQKSKAEPKQNKEVAPMSYPPRKQVDDGNHAPSHGSKENHRPISLGRQLANEKQMLLRRLKERSQSSEKQHPLDGRRTTYLNSNDVVALKRTPLQDIRNLPS